MTNSSHQYYSKANEAFASAYYEENHLEPTPQMFKEKNGSCHCQNSKHKKSPRAKKWQKRVAKTAAILAPIVSVTVQIILACVC
jgi:hypothetical protein